MTQTQLDLLLILLLYGVVFLGIEWLQARRPIDSELARKSTHVVGGFLGAALPIALYRWQIVGLGLVMALAMGLSKRLNIFRSIHHAKRKGHGEVWFPLGIALLAIVEPTNDLRFVCAVLVLGLSDALASIVGLRYGRRKFYLVDHHWKTYLGSSVFFLSSLIIIATVFHVLAGLPIGPNLALYGAVSFALTLLEALSHNGYDNILLPLATALLLRLAHLS